MAIAGLGVGLVRVLMMPNGMLANEKWQSAAMDSQLLRAMFAEALRRDRMVTMGSSTKDLDSFRAVVDYCVAER